MALGRLLVGQAHLLEELGDVVGVDFAPADLLSRVSAIWDGNLPPSARSRSKACTQLFLVVHRGLVLLIAVAPWWWW
jgi:hypothetical protein